MSRVPQECLAEIGSMSAKGLLRMDDAALIARSRFNFAVLSQLDTTACAALARSRPGSKASAEIRKPFEEHAMERWPDVAAVGFEAALAELHEYPRPRAASREEAARAVARVLSGLSPSDIARAAAALRDVAHASDADACWATRLLYERAARGDDAEAATLARVLAGPALEGVSVGGGDA
jgi:hypothetical protein